MIGHTKGGGGGGGGGGIQNISRAMYVILFIN